MQSLSSSVFFKAFFVLFKKKYSKFSEHIDFLLKFDKKRMKENSKMWFKGASICAPSINNGCKRFNSNIKKNHLTKQL
ncbi:hypothetical protein A3Q56_05522 [Intoshia linei]|uniref:Uncharacterized protein n=1 Tax=Intoshia linei TaxID=1819745 RepID=A0A177AZE9_9BILA|nr:hypothetical protein A3Q56_05522 [Intoshia linei]